MAHVRRLHGSQQTLPKGPVRVTMNWSNYRFNDRICPAIFSRLLFRVSSDHIKGRRPEQDIFHHSVWCLLL
jgi:hypothetical protein